MHRVWGLQNTIQYPLNPLYPNNKVLHKKSKKLKPNNLGWNNTANEVKKKKGRKRKFLHFTHPIQSPSQPKGKNAGTKEKKGWDGIKKLGIG